LQNRCASARSSGSSVNAPRKSSGTCSSISWRRRSRSASARSPKS